MKKITDELIQSITERVNKKIHKRFPMLEKPVEDWMVEEILLVEQEIKKRGSNTKNHTISPR